MSRHAKLLLAAILLAGTAILPPPVRAQLQPAAQAAPTTPETPDIPAPTPPRTATARRATTPPPSPPENEIRITGLGSSSAPWTIVLLLTFLTLIPSLLICMTPFARLLVVFHFLRQALGLQTTPSNQTLIGLTLVMTFFIMEPVGNRIYEQSFLPLQSGKITAFEAIARGEQPMREFMSHYVREKDAALFLEIAHEPAPHTINDLSMRVLLPAYIVSELKAGFQIGAVLFLPFLVVDMVVASIADEDAEEASGDGEGDGLHEELGKDFGLAGSNGAADADLAGSLGDGEKHDVHDADAANDERDGGDGDQEGGHGAARAVKGFPELVEGDFFKARDVAGDGVGDFGAHAALGEGFACLGGDR